MMTQDLQKRSLSMSTPFSLPTTISVVIGSIMIGAVGLYAFSKSLELEPPPVPAKNLP